MKTDLNTAGAFSQGKLHELMKKKDPLKKDLLPQEVAKKPDPDFKLDLKSPGLPSIPKPPTPSLSTEAPSLEKPKPKPEVKKIETPKIEEVREGSVKKPTVLFIKGLDIFSSPSTSEGGYAGVGKIAESVKGSRLYGWDQKDEIIKEIKKTHPDYPVILIGHSLGGDTAIEIADQLDSLEHGFRSVDLLVTMDAIGFSHDIIPQNVKDHLNIFGERGILLNDGPHVARRHEKTGVKNILSPLDHTEIDDDKEIQFEIFERIQKALGGRSLV